MPACYDNLFAFRPPVDCGEPVVPTSGLYVDTEAVTFASVSQSGRHTFQSAQIALNAKTQEAFYKVRTMLQAELMRYGFVFRQGGEPPKSCACGNSCTPKAAWNGEKPKNSPYSAIYVDKIAFTPTATNPSLVVPIRDGAGNILWSTSVSATVGVRTSVTVAQSFSVSLFVQIPDACALDVTAYVQCDMDALLCDFMEYYKLYLLHEVRAMLLSDMLIFSQPTTYTAGYVATDPLKLAFDYQKKEADKAFRSAIAATVGAMRKRDNYCVTCSPNAPRIRPQ